MNAMRFVTYRKGRELRLGILRGERMLDLLELSQAAGRPTSFLSDMSQFLEAGKEALEFAHNLVEDSRGSVEGQSLAAVRLGPPVPRPQKIIAVGLNYRDHSEEAGFKLPAYPLLFAKFSNSITGPYDPIISPAEDVQIDSEAELAVVIGRQGKAITEAAAFDYVAGYMALNDVSARKWQFADKQWTRGKSLDTFCPTGPWLITRDEVPEPHKLHVTGRVNGEIFQDSSTEKLIFGIPRLVSFISEAITLEPGDIIATGTPSGVGVFRKPPVFLKAGDVAEVEIEKVGTLRNPIT
jgi:2-keto-4-pentenoate hydratase/2-oxohepta-3-ene-1,7-dioic acid hydratase in catechol pathway